eukprot:COSAG04_NODE_603_length_12170_cov_2.393836_8_plen_62_part_00
MAEWGWYVQQLYWNFGPEAWRFSVSHSETAGVWGSARAAGRANRTWTKVDVVAARIILVWR